MALDMVILLRAHASSSGSNSIPNETISDGECTGCNSYVEANFNGCSDCMIFQVIKTCQM